MPFSDIDKAVQFKEYGSRRILAEFSEKKTDIGILRTGHLTEKKMGNRKHRPKAYQSGRLRLLGDCA